MRTAVERHAEGKKAVWEQDRDGKRGGNVDETHIWAVSWWGRKGNMLPEAGSHTNYNFN